MSEFQRERIRLKVATDAKAGTSGVTDDITGSSPDCWRGTNVQFEIGLFFADELIDISNIQTLTLLGKDSANITGTKLLEKSISAADMNATLTQDAWDAGTAQHATIEFSPAEMNIDLRGQNSRTIWLAIHGVSNDGERLMFGAAKLTVYETGIDTAGGGVTPVLGSNLIPGGSVYDGSGNFTFSVTAGKVYEWAKGSNDTSIINGTETYTVSSRFTAQGATVTLTGTAAASVTAALRDGIFYTANEVNALLDGVLKTINKPGAVIWATSENGRYKRGFACTNDGDVAYPKIDRDAAP